MPIRISPIWAAFVAACIFNLLTINVFAQEGQVQDGITLPETASEPPGSDPIAAAEQSIILGEGLTGAAAPVPAVSFFSLFRILLSLALVAGAIYGLIYLIKRMSRGSAARDPFLRVLASTSLGTNRGVYVVSVGSRAWLIGMAENAVNMISEIDDNDILNAMLLEESRKSSEYPAASRLPDFRSLLRRLGMPMESNAAGPENIRKRRERLKG